MTDLEKLNRFTRREHTEEEVYLFDVILCDNDIDRDQEAFSDAALEQMCGLFIGKTGISDHDPKAGGQTARIFDAAVVPSDRLTRDGRPYKALKARAYMIRTDSNADLIREIEGGIKKEVSVSCSAAHRYCSVCGEEAGACTHMPGRMYGDKRCYRVLDDIQDAYEWSFVAVPAQVQAGVTKQYTTKEDKDMDEKHMEIMEQVAKMLRGEVLQLCSQKDWRFSRAMQMAADKMDVCELMAFKQALLEEQSGKAEVQLAPEEGDSTEFCTHWC